MNYLRDIRKSRGLTMKELGKKVSTSEAAIGYYETGKRSINDSMLTKLAEVLECSTDDILKGPKKPATNGDGLEESIDPTQLSEDQKCSMEALKKLNPHYASVARGLIESLVSAQQAGDTQ